MDRKLQLNLINEFYGTKFKLNEIDKISFFDELFLNLQIKIDEKKYPGSIFFFNENIVYMELDTKSKERYLYCSYKYIWSIFEREFSMEYNDIQSFIKGRVEKHFNRGPVTPSMRPSPHQLVEKHFNRGPVTPERATSLSLLVEKHFNRGPVTPIDGRVYRLGWKSISIGGQ